MDVSLSLIALLGVIVTGLCKAVYHLWREHQHCMEGQLIQADRIGRLKQVILMVARHLPEEVQTEVKQAIAHIDDRADARLAGKKWDSDKKRLIVEPQ